MAKVIWIGIKGAERFSRFFLAAFAIIVVKLLLKNVVTWKVGGVHVQTEFDG
ncbi:hypothetical protein QTL97_02000 [Sporosarcina thermotolerans]|uniref:Uncharacterized protein n=1 Tax=Sporosarcina thermotolerans TaxID=633404 RepID=A0AAW9A649_9BACL|nr:hypothetical protein [Sporosarcina thermotolerans]MDW0115710.1 hypothetical protein [Sporosarcina thermotolerans]WHT47030.1 hypothetical protein QNH10_11930 [Sporosarcina thermotolerans]